MPDSFEFDTFETIGQTTFTNKSYTRHHEIQVGRWKKNREPIGDFVMVVQKLELWQGKLKRSKMLTSFPPEIIRWIGQNTEQILASIEFAEKNFENKSLRKRS